jgi:hypothetical protein
LRIPDIDHQFWKHISSTSTTQTLDIAQMGEWIERNNPGRGAIESNPVRPMAARQLNIPSSLSLLALP